MRLDSPFYTESPIHRVHALGNRHAGRSRGESRRKRQGRRWELALIFAVIGTTFAFLKGARDSSLTEN
jgi:hypothetical protein